MWTVTPNTVTGQLKVESVASLKSRGVLQKVLWGSSDTFLLIIFKEKSQKTQRRDPHVPPALRFLAVPTYATG